MVLKKVAFLTLGCKVNKYETEAVREMFLKEGYIEVDFSDFSDVYVVNTCTVTNMSDRKSRQMIRKANKQNKNATIIVMGCYAQTKSNEVMQIEGVSLVIGTNDRKNIINILNAYQDNTKSVFVSDIMKVNTFENLAIESFEEQARGYIKIEEGCNQFCSYCIIPFARGPVRSRAREDIYLEAKRLAQKGYLEIVLVGIHASSYGEDLDGVDLADIIGDINSIDGIKRIRLSSIEPMAISAEFIDKIKSFDKLCKHFHLSLQSGCNETLARMNRKYTKEEYEGIVNHIRECFDDVCITTDIMVGFPGETDEEFKESMEFAEKIGFSDMHIFKYSKRDGTRAALFDGQVAENVKEERSKKLFELRNKSVQSFLEKFIGKTVEVLFEHERKDGYMEGKTDNYITVIAKCEKTIIGKMSSVKIEKIDDDIAIGKLL